MAAKSLWRARQFKVETVEIKLKRLGKKRLKSFSVELKEPVKTLRDLIVQIVDNEVDKFNKKLDNANIITFLTEQEIKEQSKDGKVSFGELHNQTKVPKDEATENALLAFKDGLFVVFIDDKEIKEIDEVITLRDNSEVLFLRLTFLTGTYW